MEFSVFTWNLQVFTKDVSADYASHVCRKIIDALEADTNRYGPFIGTLLEIKANNLCDAQVILSSILSILNRWREEVKGGVSFLGGLGSTSEWIIYIYYKMDTVVVSLDVTPFFTEAISYSMQEEFINYADSVERNGGILDRQMYSKLPRKEERLKESFGKKVGEHERKELAKYERVTKKIKKTDKGARLSDIKEYRHEHSFSKNLIKASKRIKHLQQELYKSNKSYSPSVFSLDLEKEYDNFELDEDVKNIFREDFIRIISSKSTFKNKISEWYRGGIIISAQIDGKYKINIASAHLPGPDHTNNNIQILESYLMAAFVQDADIFIGDFNVYGSIEKMFFEDKTGLVKQTTVRSEDYSKIHRPLDRILRRINCPWDVHEPQAYSPETNVPVDPQLPEKTEIVNISDHYLLKAVVRVRPVNVESE